MKFDHHPDPAIDFCVEVEELQGMAYNRSVGFDPEPDLDRRLEKALTFRVAAEEAAIRDLIVNHPRSGNPCTACGTPFFDGDTCGRGGCPCGGDF